MTTPRPTTVVYCGTSLDGFIAREDGGIDFLDFPGIEPGDDLGWSEFIAKIDGLVMGRGTFEVLLGFDAWHYGDRPLIVLSTTLREVPAKYAGRVELSNLAPAALLAELHRRGLRRVYIDGGRTVQSFLDEDLIDELIVTQLPVLIGAGKPLFGPLGTDLVWEHVSTDVIGPGFVKSHYRRAR